MARIKCKIGATEVFIPLTEGIHFHYDIQTETQNQVQENNSSIDSIKFFSTNIENQKNLMDIFNQLKPLFTNVKNEKLQMQLSYVTDENAEDIDVIYNSTTTCYPISVRYEVSVQDGILSFNLNIYIRNEV